MIVSSGAQVAERRRCLCNRRAGPPVMATFLSVVPSTNPTHWPSGETKTQFKGAAPVTIAGGVESIERADEDLVVAADVHDSRAVGRDRQAARPLATVSAAVPDDAIVMRTMRGGAVRACRAIWRVHVSPPTTTSATTAAIDKSRRTGCRRAWTAVRSTGVPAAPLMTS